MDIEKMLKDSGVDHEIYKHEPVYTSEQAAKIRRVSLSQGVKAMVFEAKEGFVLVLTPANKKVDVKKLGSGKTKLASPEKVFRVTGYEIGAVPPFGHKIKIKTFIDTKLLKHEWVYFNIGLHTKSARIHGSDLLKFIKDPVICRISL